MCKCDCISIQIHLNQCGCAYRAAEVNARGRARSRRTASIPQTLPACDGASRVAIRQARRAPVRGRVLVPTGGLAAAAAPLRRSGAFCGHDANASAAPLPTRAAGNRRTKIHNVIQYGPSGYGNTPEGFLHLSAATRRLLLHWERRNCLSDSYTFRGGAGVGVGAAVGSCGRGSASYESPAASMIQVPSPCLLALKLYVTPLMVVLRALIPVPAVKNRNLPVPDESTENSADVPG